MADTMKKKYYYARINYAVDAPEWWRAARESTDLPESLLGLVYCHTETTMMSSEDVRWCRTLPHWDGLEGWPLKLWDNQGRRVKSS